MSMEINTSDLALRYIRGSLQSELFEQIRLRILDARWSSGARLPSTRALASQLRLSRNTVILAYEQLVAEGYLVAQKGSGYYVARLVPDHYLSSAASHKALCQESRRSVRDVSPSDGLFSPGVADLAEFPMAHWQRLLSRHANRSTLLGNQDLQGLLPLRQALHSYLTASRSVSCHPDQIIITSGAQQAIAIALLATRTSSAERAFLVESPGYKQVIKALEVFAIPYESVDVNPSSGWDIEKILTSGACGIYLTPSNQYPMGRSMPISERLQLIDWSKRSQSWVIEDDYDSEFQFESRPLRSMQGLSVERGHAGRMIYIGSMSKVMFNALRIGYMVVPDSLIERCMSIKDAMSGDSPSHVQAALADFIDEGGLVRHIRKMRRLYEQKYQQILVSIERYLGNEWAVTSQGAGLHVTVSWTRAVDEQRFAIQAKEKGIVVRPLTYYEPVNNPREYGAVVLGFGNAPLKHIDEHIRQLAEIFQALCTQVD